jgi:hypothetical protein
MSNAIKTSSLSDAEIIDALSTLANECFPAMNFANAFAGSSSRCWDIVRGVGAKDLLAEALHRDLAVNKIKGNVDDSLLKNAPWAKHILPAEFSYADYLKSTHTQPQAENATMTM